MFQKNTNTVIKFDAVNMSPPSPLRFKQLGRGFYLRRGKRFIDIAAVILLAPQALLLIAIAAILVARDGGNPFFIQKRVGRGGRVFHMVKLRSMVRDSEAVFARHLRDNPEAAREWHVHQKLEHDPRITAFGRFIRKTSIDELPQLWNVLWGDMSMIGPRPFMVEQESLYPGSAYYMVRPGMTGPWQVSDRSEGAFVARRHFDDDYVRDLSFRSDMKIVMQTLGVLLRATGR